MTFRIFTLLLLLPLTIHAQQITLSGTMHHSDIEGGCWYLQSDSGKPYELTGDSLLMMRLHIDGQHVVVRGVRAKGAASICMMGEIVHVTQRIDDVRYPIDPVISPIMVDGIVHRTKSGVWYVKTKSGLKFEFEDAPDQKYRKIGTAVHRQFRILLDRKYTKENMNGVILSDIHAQAVRPPAPIAKQKTYDSR